MEVKESKDLGNAKSDVQVKSSTANKPALLSFSAPSKKIKIEQNEKKKSMIRGSWIKKSMSSLVRTRNYKKTWSTVENAQES